MASTSIFYLSAWKGTPFLALPPSLPPYHSIPQQQVHQVGPLQSGRHYQPSLLAGAPQLVHGQGLQLLSFLLSAAATTGGSLFFIGQGIGAEEGGGEGGGRAAGGGGGGDGQSKGRDEEGQEEDKQGEEMRED